MFKLRLIIVFSLEQNLFETKQKTHHKRKLISLTKVLDPAVLIESTIHI